MEKHHCGEGGKRPYHHGAKTFRRGRVIAFLHMLRLKRSTIKQQLDEPEFQSIRQTLVGELKAIDMIINEFIQLFEIHESEITETWKNEPGETTETNDKETLHDERNNES